MDANTPTSSDAKKATKIALLKTGVCTVVAHVAAAEDVATSFNSAELIEMLQDILQPRAAKACVVALIAEVRKMNTMRDGTWVVTSDDMLIVCKPGAAPAIDMDAVAAAAAAKLEDATFDVAPVPAPAPASTPSSRKRVSPSKGGQATDTAKKPKKPRISKPNPPLSPEQLRESAVKAASGKPVDVLGKDDTSFKKRVLTSREDVDKLAAVVVKEAGDYVTYVFPGGLEKLKRGIVSTSQNTHGLEGDRHKKFAFVRDPVFNTRGLPINVYKNSALMGFPPSVWKFEEATA